ncbi:pyridoxal phosphate-dependent decarboxylase family protein [candidate division KSB1 bacterium]
MKKNHKIYSDASQEEVAEDIKPLLEFQENGLELNELKRLVNDRLIPHFVRYDNDGFFSLYNFFPETGAEYGAEVALKYNQGVTNWQVSPGGAVLEELCCGALCRLFGFGPQSDATFMYSGTYANQEALYLALHKKAEQNEFDLGQKGLKGFKDPEKLTVVTSPEAHFSVNHAVRILGLGEQSIVTLPVDENRRIDTRTMKDDLKKIRKTRDIFCVVITAGTTSTGSIDPILPAVKICRDINTWVHVDAAYGLAYSILPEFKSKFEGIDQADSVTWDPHKQFGVPIPNSVLFVSNKSDFDRIAVFSEYFNRKDESVPNPGLKSPPSTRPLSALPLVTTIRHLGMKKITERLRAPVKAISQLADFLDNELETEVMHKPDIGILCIRITPKNFPENQLDELQKYIYKRAQIEGKYTVSMSKISNSVVLRFLTLSPDVTFDKLKETVIYLQRLALGFHHK